MPSGEGTARDQASGAGARSIERAGDPQGLHERASSGAKRGVHSSLLIGVISAVLLLVALGGLGLRFWASRSTDTPEELALQVLWVACLALAAGLFGIAVVQRKDSRVHQQTVEALRESERRSREFAEERARAQSALRSSEQELADFFENATVGLHWVGADGIIQRVNRAELEMLGYEAREYVGRHIREFHVDRALIDDMLERLSRGEVIRNVPAQMRAKDGSVRDVMIDSSVLWQDGKFVHTRCFTRDITSFRRAEAEVSELREALEHTVDGIAKIGPDGRILSVNPAYAAMYGRTPPEMVGLDRRSIVHAEDVAVFEAGVQAMFKSGKAEVDLRGIRKDGSIFFERAALVASHAPDGRVTGWYSFIKDVSQRKLSERQLRESFARQNELFRREKTLLRELNHRVRNNLAGLLGLVGLYERSGRSATEIGAAIRGKVRAMKEVHDMISRTHGTPVDLALLVGRMAADRTPEEGSGRIIATGPTVDVPPSQAVAMAMVLQELMTNARKYGALSVPGGKVSINWTYDENAPERVLRMDWAETGGPRPEPDPRPDVGLNLIEGLSGAELQGKCEFSFQPEGLRFTLEALLEGAATARPVPA